MNEKKNVYIFYSLSVWSQPHLMLNDNVAQDGGDDKPCGETGFQVQLPEHTYKYLATDFQLDDGS